MPTRGFRGGRQRARAVERLIERDGNRCWYCGFAFGDGDRECTIDHVVPVSHGGSNRLENLRLACFYCNTRRARVPVGVFEWSDLLAARRWQAYRAEMLASGRWLPKRAFHHDGIRWHGEHRWECDNCGQSSATLGPTPAAVPCAPWCDEARAEWELWWHGPHVAPTHWPNGEEAIAATSGLETRGEAVRDRSTLDRLPTAALLLTKGDAMPQIR